MPDGDETDGEFVAKRFEVAANSPKLDGVEGACLQLCYGGRRHSEVGGDCLLSDATLEPYRAEYVVIGQMPCEMLVDPLHPIVRAVDSFKEVGDDMEACVGCGRYVGRAFSLAIPKLGTAQDLDLAPLGRYDQSWPRSSSSEINSTAPSLARCPITV
jgi:hypothetical protein